MEITSYNLKHYIPYHKVQITLSLPYSELRTHLTTMINAHYHLVCVDSIVINKINYFNLLWTSNYEPVDHRSNTSKQQSHQAKPPPYVIFYDLNPAQMAHIYKEYSIDLNWNIELIESYVRVIKPRKNEKSKCEKLNPTLKSHEEIFFMCQFRNVSSTELHVNKESYLNKLKHAVADTRFKESLSETVKYSVTKQNYMPIRITPVLMNVNSVSNKHFYFTSLYKPIDLFKNKEENIENEKNTDAFMSSYYCVRKEMTDNELFETHEDFVRIRWKLIDLKAYKDKNLVTKFVAIWTVLDGFYEGVSRLFIGLSEAELLNVNKEMNSKGLYPKLLTNYGYLNSAGEHVYAVFYCQF